MTPLQQVIFHFYDFNQVSLKPKYILIMHSIAGWKTGIPLSVKRSLCVQTLMTVNLIM